MIKSACYAAKWGGGMYQNKTKGGSLGCLTAGSQGLGLIYQDRTKGGHLGALQQEVKG